jgi:hypothetical protein
MQRNDSQGAAVALVATEGLVVRFAALPSALAFTIGSVRL